MAAETTVGKVEGKETEKVVVCPVLTGAYFFHVEACQGGSREKCR